MKKNITALFILLFFQPVFAQATSQCEVDKTIERLNKVIHRNACLDAFYGGGLQSAPATFPCDGALFGSSNVRYQPTANTIDFLDLKTSRNSRIRRSFDLNTLVFLNMSMEDQKKVMGKWPELCVRYSDLADKMEGHLKVHHPMPEFAIQSCTADNTISEVIVRYRNGGRGSYVVKRNGNNLSVKANSPNRRNYELQLTGDPKKGVDSMPRFTTTLRDGAVGKTNYNVAQIKENPDRSNMMQLEAALEALNGFNIINTRTGSNCEDNVSADALLNEILKKEAAEAVQ